MADLILTFARSINNSTGKPQWLARQGGMLYQLDESSLMRPSVNRTRFCAIEVGSRGSGVRTVVLKDYLGELAASVEVSACDMESFDRVTSEFNTAEPLDLEFVRGYHKGREQWKSLLKDSTLGTSTLYVVDNDSPKQPSVGGESWRCVPVKKVYPNGADYDATGFRIVLVTILEELAPRAGQGGADFIVEAQRTESGAISLFRGAKRVGRKRVGIATNVGQTTEKGKNNAPPKNGGGGTSRDARRRARKRALKG